MNIWRHLTRRREYRKTWGTRVGQDCISLDTSLAAWLGARLTFLAEHAHGYPADRTPEEWAAQLRENGARLNAYVDHHSCETTDAEERVIAEGQVAMRWVAENLPTLWD